MKKQITLNIIIGCLLACTLCGANTPHPDVDTLPPRSSQHEISDTEAIAFALEALAKRGSKPDYTETEILRHNPGIISVTFVKPIPQGTLGSDKIITVKIDSNTGRLVDLHGY